MLREVAVHDRVVFCSFAVAALLRHVIVFVIFGVVVAR